MSFSTKNNHPFGWLFFIIIDVLSYRIKITAIISTIVFLFLKDQVSSNYFGLWGFPMPESMLEPYNLVQRKCIGNTKVYKAVLIYRKDYTLTKLEKHFLNALCNQKETMYDANRKRRFDPKIEPSFLICI